MPGVLVQVGEKLHFTSCTHGWQLSLPFPLACGHSFPPGSQWPHLPLPQTSNSAVVVQAEITIYPASSSGLGGQEGLRSRAPRLVRVPKGLGKWKAPHFIATTTAPPLL